MGADDSTAWSSAATAAPRQSSAGFIIGGVVTAFLVISAALYQPVKHSVTRFTASVCNTHGFTQPYNLSEHPDFQDLSVQGDAVWRSLFLENGNYLYRQTPSQSGADEIRTYGVGMFHQLHCLYMIRITLQTLNATAHGEEPSSKHEFEGHHYLHCLDYLRQTILCLADDTIEPPHRDAHDSSWDIVDGRGPRMCRSNDHLYDWAQHSGPSLEYRKKLLVDGATWPKLEGIVWPEPLD